MLGQLLQDGKLRDVASSLGKHIRSEKGMVESVRITLKIMIFWS